VSEVPKGRTKREMYIQVNDPLVLELTPTCQALI
jgi:hypothetical protein